MSAFSDKTMTCRDCGAEFVWTAGEQEFYQQKGFQYPPARCPKCRDVKKQQATAGFDIVCAKCGQPAKVKFQPKGDRPVYCFDCYKAMQSDQPAAPTESDSAPAANPAPVVSDDQAVPAAAKNAKSDDQVVPADPEAVPVEADSVTAEETTPQA